MSFDLKIVRGDIVFNKDGDVSTVFDNAKLRQDIVKILLTKPGENKFHPLYGSNTGALQVGHIADQALLELDLSSSAEDAIRYLIRLQQQQQKYQYLTAGEIIVGIKNISVVRDLLDPRMYNIFISVYTKNLTTIEETIPVRII